MHRSEAVCDDLGHKNPTCNHAQNFRNKKTGVHSNDAESEMARFKKWTRSKWTATRTVNSKSAAKKKAHLHKHVQEYILQTNLGKDMAVTMSTLVAAFAGLAGVPLQKKAAVLRF